MTLDKFRELLNRSPESVKFEQAMEVVEKNYDYTPTAFRNGTLENAQGENEGSCKLLAFAKLQGLSEQDTLHCFGDYYRNDVLRSPNGDNHMNIRNFIKSGWAGVEFSGEPLKPMKDR